MAVCSLTALEIDACSSEFAKAAQNEVLFRAILLQLACNLSTGSVLTSDNGTQYRLVVSDGGVLSTEAV